MNMGVSRDVKRSRSFLRASRGPDNVVGNRDTLSFLCTVSAEDVIAKVSLLRSGIARGKHHEILVIEIVF